MKKWTIRIIMLPFMLYGVFLVKLLTYCEEAMDYWYDKFDL